MVTVNWERSHPRCHKETSRLLASGLSPRSTLFSPRNVPIDLADQQFGFCFQPIGSLPDTFSCGALGVTLQQHTLNRNT